MLLTKFMVFKETDPFVFNSKWNWKKVILTNIYKFYYIKYKFNYIN